MKKNKKGFTLVELLAVIVILALIMSIAVVSIGGILQSTRQSTFKETAANIIDGVQKQLLVANELKDGYYLFDSGIVEKGGLDSPLGGAIRFHDVPSGSSSQGTGNYTRIGNSPVYRVAVDATHPMVCNGNRISYVHVQYNASAYKYTYSICLTAGSGNYRITDEAVSQSDTTSKSEYSRLLNSGLVDMLKNDN